LKLYELENGDVIDLDKIDCIYHIIEGKFFNIQVNGEPARCTIYESPEVDIKKMRNNLIAAWSRREFSERTRKTTNKH